MSPVPSSWACHPCLFRDQLGAGSEVEQRGTGPSVAAELTATDGAILEFARQFSLDVSSVTDGQRSALFGMLGDKVAGIAAIIFVMDFLPRTRAALDALVGRRWPGSTRRGPETVRRPARSGTRWVPSSGTYPSSMPWTRSPPSLSGSGAPVSTSAGCASHCGAGRRCWPGPTRTRSPAWTSTRTATSSPLQKAALAFTDAMIWTPGRLEPVAARLVELASAEQRVELVLDVTRNALNKIAVALGADAAHVEDGHRDL